MLRPGHPDQCEPDDPVAVVGERGRMRSPSTGPRRGPPCRSRRMDLLGGLVALHVSARRPRGRAAGRRSRSSVSFARSAACSIEIRPISTPISTFIGRSHSDRSSLRSRPRSGSRSVKPPSASDTAASSSARRTAENAGPRRSRSTHWSGFSKGCVREQPSSPAIPDMRTTWRPIIALSANWRSGRCAIPECVPQSVSLRLSFVRFSGWQKQQQPEPEFRASRNATPPWSTRGEF